MDAREAGLRQMLTFDTDMRMIAAASGVMQRAVTGANRAVQSGGRLTTVFPQTKLGGQLEQVAKVRQVRSQLGMSRQRFFWGMGGFDNHIDQMSNHDVYRVGIWADGQPVIESRQRTRRGCHHFVLGREGERRAVVWDVSEARTERAGRWWEPVALDPDVVTGALCRDFCIVVRGGRGGQAERVPEPDELLGTNGEHRFSANLRS